VIKVDVVANWVCLEEDQHWQEKANVRRKRRRKKKKRKIFQNVAFVDQLIVVKLVLDFGVALFTRVC
jgi:hypothetical protein